MVKTSREGDNRLEGNEVRVCASGGREGGWGGGCMCAGRVRMREGGRGYVKGGGRGGTSRHSCYVEQRQGSEGATTLKQDCHHYCEDHLRYYY